MGNHNQFLVHLGCSLCHGSCVVGTDSHEVPQTAVWCDVGDFGSVESGKPVQGAQLVEDIVLDFVGAESHVPAAKTPQVGKAGVRTDTHPAADAFSNCGCHDVRITGMEPASDVGA